MELQEKISTSLVEYLELKISTHPSLISGLKTPVVVRHKLEPTPVLSPSLQFNCLMLLVISVQLLSLQTTSQVASLQWHLRVWQFKVSFKTSIACTIPSLLRAYSYVVTMLIHVHVVPPSSVSLTSNVINSIQIVGSGVMLTYTVELNSAILGSEIFLLTVDAQLSKDGTLLALDRPRVSDTIVTYTAQLNSFQRSDFGNYTCKATITPQPSSIYLTGIDTLSDTLSIKAGKYLYCMVWCVMLV